jgi:hypothetical protein
MFLEPSVLNSSMYCTVPVNLGTKLQLLLRCTNLYILYISPTISMCSLYFLALLLIIAACALLLSPLQDYNRH